MTPKVEFITDATRFAAVGSAWQSPWQRAGGRIFQRHDWLSGWLEGVQDRREIRPYMVLAWDGPVLVGALPCAVHRRSGVRLLQWAAQVFSDYCDVLIDPAHPDILPVLWEAMWRCGGFDLVSLQQVRPDASCRAFLDRLAAEGPLHPGERTERCMRIENRWPNGEAFFRSLNKKGRNNHTRGKRILGELGGEVTFRVIEPNAAAEPGSAEPERAEPVLAELVRLKDVWLRANDPASPLLGADAAVLRTVLRRAWDTGLAKIFLLEVGGRIAAASVNFVYDGRMEAYFTAYDAAYERASPGTILIVDYAKWSFDRSLTMVDFLRGDEGFKFRLANAETMLDSYAGSRTLMGQVAISGHRWLSRLRQKPEAVTAAPPAAEELEAAE
ncbi:MAG TPA: GNAT family N-acetyltransferase [Rhodopila sp.]|nr:GNAT family N-acetyltransferase [Rhodopila sp.]